YVVLPGVWPSLMLRGGQRASRITRVMPAAQGGESTVSGAFAVSAAPQASETPEAPRSPTTADALAVPATPPALAISHADPAPIGTAASSSASQPASSATELTAPSFQASLVA